jgi:rhamnose transport system substrate-binding protein
VNGSFWMRVAAVAALTLGTFGCGGAEKDDRLTIGVMPKLIGIDYFNATQKGALKAAEELDVNVVFDGPVQPDVTQQAQMIESWITRRFDAIAVAPNDPGAISGVLDKARQRGIKTLTWDTEAQEHARDWFVNQASSEAIARTLVDIMAEGVGPNAQFIYIIGTLTAANQNAWMNLMNEYIQQQYPEMRDLAGSPRGSEEDQALATQVATDSLRAFPQMNGMFALTSVSLPGAAEALRKANAAERVYLTGLATPKAMREYIKDGTVERFALWNPEDLGYLTVYAAVATLRGELNPGDTSFQAGHLGTVEIAGSEILLGPPLIFDAANIDDYDF